MSTCPRGPREKLAGHKRLTEGELIGREAMRDPICDVVRSGSPSCSAGWLSSHVARLALIDVVAPPLVYVFFDVLEILCVLVSYCS